VKKEYGFKFGRHLEKKTKNSGNYAVQGECRTRDTVLKLRLAIFCSIPEPANC